MAKINKRKAVKQSTGLPTKEQILTSPEMKDTIPAQIMGQDGQPQAPAALTEGEFVISVPAIIALGEGDYDSGLEILTQMHDELRAVGTQMEEELQATSPGMEGLAAVPMG